MHSFNDRCIAGVYQIPFLVDTSHIIVDWLCSPNKSVFANARKSTDQQSIVFT